MFVPFVVALRRLWSSGIVRPGDRSHLRLEGRVFVIGVNGYGVGRVVMVGVVQCVKCVADGSRRDVFLVVR